MRAHRGLLAAQVVGARRGKAGAEELSQLVLGEAQGLVTQAAEVAALQALPRGKLAVDLADLGPQPLEEPQAAVEQRGAAQGHRGVPCVQQVKVGPLLLEQAVPLLDGARVGCQHARKAAVCLASKVVELVSPEGGTPLDQLQVVGGKEHAHQGAGDLGGLDALSVAEELPAARDHVAAQVDHAAVPLQARRGAGGLGTLAHQLGGRGVPEGVAGREQLQSLDRIGLARGVWPAQDGGRRREADDLLPKAPEVLELKRLDQKSHEPAAPLEAHRHEQVQVVDLAV